MLGESVSETQVACLLTLLFCTHQVLHRPYLDVPGFPPVHHAVFLKSDKHNHLLHNETIYIQMSHFVQNNEMFSYSS
jgi:hypothetical protein